MGGVCLGALWRGGICGGVRGVGWDGVGGMGWIGEGFGPIGRGCEMELCQLY
jgi:hypothetical protein